MTSRRRGRSKEWITKRMAGEDRRGGKRKSVERIHGEGRSEGNGREESQGKRRREAGWKNELVKG